MIIVDDEPHLVASLRGRLRKNDWELVTTTEPKALFETLSDGRGGVVVTDWQMPSISGLELVRRIRLLEKSDPTASRAHIVLMTGHLDDAIVVDALETGADEFMMKPFKLPELVARVRVGIRVLEYQRRLQVANGELERLARTDTLTGLANRRAGHITLEGELERTERGLQALGVVLLDVDHFKSVNDTHGHEAGDAVLVEVARRLSASVRGYDTVVRWGGEEFLMIVPGATPPIVAAVAQRVRTSIASTPIDMGDGEITVTASLGMSCVASGAVVAPTVLLAAADEALYRAKANGRDQVCVNGVRLVDTLKPAPAAEQFIQLRGRG